MYCVYCKANYAVPVNTVVYVSPFHHCDALACDVLMWHWLFAIVDQPQKVYGQAVIKFAKLLPQFLDVILKVCTHICKSFIC